jgi:arginyl-tRNA synthetase
MSPEELSSLIVSIVSKLVQSGQAGKLSADQVPDAAHAPVMRPKDRSHGDWASNIALQLGKRAGMAPRQLGNLIAAQLGTDRRVGSVEVAGPGFINVTLNAAASAEVVDTVLEQKADFGTNQHLAGRTLNLEFVSANPTGPIHIGGTRWAAVGDSMARVLQANGAQVIREYYFNDHGTQIDRFAKSLVAAAHHEPIPADGYKGTYIQEIADKVIAQAKADGVDILSLPRVDGGKDENGNPLGEGDSVQREEFRKRAVPMMFTEIQHSMENFRVHFDVWFHEQKLYDDGEVKKALALLTKLGMVYQKDGATWLRTSKYGDDKDRVVIRSNGLPSYFCSDVAYYYNKRHRAQGAADTAIYMLGADHHGYIGRLMAVCAAYGDKPNVNMQILIGQLVNVYKDGKIVRMSKRAGNIVTIDDLVDAVGVDAARYSLVRTSYNQTLDIDLNLLVQHTNDNPVYYVQYAHARACNVDRNAAAAGITHDGADLSLLDMPDDEEVLAQLALWPSVVSEAADMREPHRIAHYLETLAGAYHTWYAKERVVPMPLTDPEKRGDPKAVERLEHAKNPEPARAAARLKLNDAVKQVVENGLSMLAVSAPDKM